LGKEFGRVNIRQTKVLKDADSGRRQIAHYGNIESQFSNIHHDGSQWDTPKTSGKSGRFRELQVP
jgi:hypothetical protein